MRQDEMSGVPVVVAGAGPAGLTAAISRSADTTRPVCTSRSARRARSFAPGIRTGPVPSSISSGPRIRNSIAVNSARMVGQLPPLSDHAAAVVWASL
jgi:thioredoxin reductase